MDDSALRDYFLRPSCPSQRQYEALRAVFVEGLSQKDAAERFRYDHDAFRQLVHQFRQDVAAGAVPPFSSPKGEAAPPARLGRTPGGPTRPRSPTSAS